MAPAIVIWDGGGGDANWFTANNWSNDMVPGTGDDVELISNVGTVNYFGGSTTIKSLKLADNLRLKSGALNVTNGLIVPIFSTLYTEGAGVTFTASGTTNIESGSVEAGIGSTITLSGLTTLDNKYAAYIVANGAGSQVDLPNLTQINNGSFFRYIQTFAGGQINLPELTTLNGGYFELRAHDAGCQINAGKLTTITNPPTVPNYIIADNGGQVQVPSSLTQLDQTNLYVEGTGFPTHQLTSVKRSTLYLIGGTPSFAALTDLDRTSVIASNGTFVNFPGVVTIPDSDYGGITIEADGSATSVNFPNLTTVNNISNIFRFRAVNDGSLAITKLTSLSLGSSELYANNNGFIAATSLASISPTSPSFSYIRATSGGGMSLSSTLKALNRTQLEISGSGFPTAQLTSFNRATIYVYGGSPTFPLLTNIDSAGVSVSGGAYVSFPGVTSIGPTDYQEPYMDSSDAGSVLSFPNLTTCMVQNPSRIHFRAAYSSTINLPALTSIATGNFELRSYQNGVLNAPLVTNVTPPVGSYGYLGAFDKGQLNLGPGVTAISRVTLEIGDNGFNSGVLQSFNEGELYVYSGSPSFANLSNIDGSNFFAYYGSTITLPGVTSIGPSTKGSTFIDCGYGAATLTLPNLVSVAKQDPNRIHFRAIAGGTLTLSKLASLSAGNAQLAGLSGGTVLAPMLTDFSPPVGSYSYITSTSTSTIQVNAGLTKLDRVQLEVDRPAAFPFGQLTEFTRSAFYGYSGILDLPLVTKIDGSSFLISNDCTTTLAGVTSVGVSDFGNTSYQAYGANSVLNFPNLTTLTGADNYFTGLRAYYNGTLSIPQLAKFNGGSLDMVAAYNDSKLILSSLSEITIPLSAAGFLNVIDSGSLDSAVNLSLFNVDFAFNTTAKFDFANLDLGAKCITSGTGTLTANVSNAGVLRPGHAFSPGLLTINGNFTQTATGILRVDLGGTAAGTSFDQVAVTGQAKLDGSVDVIEINGFQPMIGNSFDVLTYASRMGNFSGFTGLDIGGGVELVPVHGMTDFRLNTVTSTGALATAFAPIGTTPGPVNFLEVTFSEPVQANSVDALDVQLTGPGGPYTFSSALQHTVNIIRIFFTTPITANGVYNVTLGPGILDLANNPMNQNGIAPDGEIPADQYTNSFTINAADLSIDSFTGVPANANFGQTLNLSWTVRNSGAIPTSGQWTDRIWLSTDNKVDFGDVFLGEKLSPGIPMPANGTYMANLSVQLPTMPANPDGPYFILLDADVYGQLAEANETNNFSAAATTLANPPRVVQVIVNDGNAQRSRVSSLTVVFSEIVSFTPNAAAAFGVARTGPGSPMDPALLATPVVDNGSGFTKVTLSFANNSVYQFGSLIDGNYRLTVIGSAVSDGTQTLDGNGDGVVGDNSTVDFFRLFGDSNGDRNVTAVDFNQFRLAYGQGPSIFDFDNDGSTSATDFNSFRLRYGVNLSP